MRARTTNRLVALAVLLGLGAACCGAAASTSQVARLAVTGAPRLAAGVRAQAAGEDQRRVEPVDTEADGTCSSSVVIGVDSAPELVLLGSVDYLEGCGLDEKVWPGASFRIDAGRIPCRVVVRREVGDRVHSGTPVPIQACGVTIPIDLPGVSAAEFRRHLRMKLATDELSYVEEWLELQPEALGDAGGPRSPEEEMKMEFVRAVRAEAHPSGEHLAQIADDTGYPQEMRERAAALFDRLEGLSRPDEVDVP